MDPRHTSFKQDMLVVQKRHGCDAQGRAGAGELPEQHVADEHRPVSTKELKMMPESVQGHVSCLSST